MTEHQPLPVAGYTAQSGDKVAQVNVNKEFEERLLRRCEALISPDPNDGNRWVAIAKTHFEEGFMALNRAIFQPKRVALPEDEPKV